MTNRIIRYRFMGWFLILQEGNSEHTLRDGSQHLFPRISVPIQGDSEHALKVAASQSNLIEPEIANRI